MKASNVIGWIVNDEYYCTACAPTNEESANAKPIFADSETDSFSHCSVCESLIPETLTAEGLDSVIQACEDFLVRRTGRSEIIKQWAEHLNGNMLVFEDSKTIELVIRACRPEMLQAAKRHLTEKIKNTALELAGVVGRLGRELDEG